MDPLERAVPFPALKVAKQRAARRKILRDRPPLTPCAEDIEQSVDDLTDIDPALVSAALRGRNQRRDHCPLLVRQIARVSQLPPVVARPVLLGPHHRASANRQRQANHKGFTRFKKFEDGHSGFALAISSLSMIFAPRAGLGLIGAAASRILPLVMIFSESAPIISSLSMIFVPCEGVLGAAAPGALVWPPPRDRGATGPRWQPRPNGKAGTAKRGSWARLSAGRSGCSVRLTGRIDPRTRRATLSPQPTGEGSDAVR